MKFIWLENGRNFSQIFCYGSVTFVSTTVSHSDTLNNVPCLISALKICLIYVIGNPPMCNTSKLIFLRHECMARSLGDEPIPNIWEIDIRVSQVKGQTKQRVG